MSAWDIFLIIAAGVGAVSAFIGAVVAIVKYGHSWAKGIHKFMQGHGVRANVNELRNSVIILNETIEGLQKLAKRNTERLCNITEELDANTRLTLKLELKSLFRNHPTEILVIKNTWKKYHDLGGDSYIDDMYEEWKEQYEKPYLAKTLKKGAK